MILATWTIVCTLVGHPAREQNRTEKYSGFATVQACEDFAKQRWKAYFSGPWSKQTDFTYHTVCSAKAHGKEWSDMITCDKNEVCQTSKYVRG